MRKLYFLFAIFFLLTEQSFSQTFLVEIESGFLSNDSCRIQVSHIQNQAVYKEVIYNNVLKFNLLNEVNSVYIPYMNKEGLFIEFWLGGQYQGGIQLYPNRLKAKNKQYLSVYVTNKLMIYNIKQKKY